jgi:hypothetical protein
MSDSSVRSPRRRRSLKTTAALGSGLLFSGRLDARTPPPPESPKKIAAIVTNYRRYSHADNIVTRFIEGYSIAGKSYPPRAAWRRSTSTRSATPISAARSRSGGKSPAEALTLGGQNLAVDAVLLIAEQGDYPTNALGQKLYLRHEFFKEIVKVFKASGRSVPVYCDKQDPRIPTNDPELVCPLQ